MTERDYDAAAQVLTSQETFEGEADISGELVPIEVREPTIGELNDLQDELPEDAKDVDAARAMIDDFLVRPAINGEDVGMTKALALFAEMQSTLQQSDAVANAKEQMPVQGNQ